MCFSMYAYVFNSYYMKNMRLLKRRPRSHTRYCADWRTIKPKFYYFDYKLYNKCTPNGSNGVWLLTLFIVPYRMQAIHRSRSCQCWQFLAISWRALWTNRPTLSVWRASEAFQTWLSAIRTSKAFQTWLSVSLTGVGGFPDVTQCGSDGRRRLSRRGSVWVWRTSEAFQTWLSEGLTDVGGFPDVAQCGSNGCRRLSTRGSVCVWRTSKAFQTWLSVGLTDVGGFPDVAQCGKDVGGFPDVAQCVSDGRRRLSRRGSVR